MGFKDSLKNVWSSLTTFSKDAVDGTGRTLHKPVKYVTEENKVTSGASSYIPTEKVKSGWERLHSSFSSVYDKAFEQDTINLDEQDIPCAYISDRVYMNPFERPRHIFGYELDEKFNEFEYALYVHKEKKTWIIGYRGTEVTSVKDYMSDLHIIFGTQAWNDRFNSSVKVYEDAVKAYPDYHTFITGHSLGGTIAYFIAKKFIPDRCVCFNPGSSANPTFAQLVADTQAEAPWTRHVFTYHISGDPISTLSYIGYSRSFHKGKLNPLSLHGISNFCTVEDTSKEVF